MRANVSNTVSFLAGLAMGAGLEYLLDPKAGEKRRRHLGKASAGAIGTLGAALGSVGHSIGEGAASVGSTVGHAASGLGSSIAHGTAEAGSTVGDWLGEVPSLFAMGGKAIGSGASTAWDGIRAFGESDDDDDDDRDDGYGAGSLLTTAALAVGVGALLMYTLDPQMGRTRRKSAGDQVRGRFNDLRDTAAGSAEGMRNRVSGYAHEARGAIRTEGPIDDDTLAQRIRSELGHVTDQMGMITVDVIDGNVTLRGSAAATAAEKILSAARGVTGVQNVEDQLTRT